MAAYRPARGRVLELLGRGGECGALDRPLGAVRAGGMRGAGVGGEGGARVLGGRGAAEGLAGVPGWVVEGLRDDDAGALLGSALAGPLLWRCWSCHGG